MFNDFKYNIIYILRRVKCMKDIIVAYPTKNTAMQLRSLLENEGFHVSYVCATGSSVLSIAQSLDEGVVICASILSDIGAGVLAERLPFGFDVIALSKNGRDEYLGNLISLPLPVNKEEFLQTVAVLVSTRNAFTVRNDNDSELITKAKLILRETNNMGEVEAHKFLQQESMKKGKKISLIAQEIINDFT